MFSSEHDFIQWLDKHGEPLLKSQLESETDKGAVKKVLDIIMRFADVRGDYDMLKISGSLGNAIPELIQAADKVNVLTDAPQKREFVIHCALALFRLIDRGVSGSEQNMSLGAQQSGMPMETDGMEITFVRPLAEQAVDEALKVFKSLGG